MSALRILWVGPWLVDSLCNQFNGSMAQAIHDTGNVIGGVIIGAEGSWRMGGYDWLHYCPRRRSVLDKAVTQAHLVGIVAGFCGDVLVLGEKAAHLAPIAYVFRSLRREKWRIVVDVRTLPIPRDEDFSVTPRALRFWLQLRAGFRFADGWMTITPGLRDTVRRRVPTRALPCLVWESAVDRGFLSHVGSSRTAERIRECGHGTNVLYLGSLGRGRRLDLCIHAMSCIDNVDGRIGLHIVGSGPHRADLESLVKAQGLDKTVHLYDPVPYPDVPSVIQACDLGILPLPPCDAWNTSSALKLYEYMGVGRPVLVSDIPAHREAVGGQPFAFFMRDYSAAGFGRALLSFASQSQSARQELGAQAREFVRRHHTWHHRARAIDEFLRKLVADGRRV